MPKKKTKKRKVTKRRAPKAKLDRALRLREEWWLKMKTAMRHVEKYDKQVTEVRRSIASREADALFGD